MVGMLPARGDSLSVYALPVTAAAPEAGTAPPPAAVSIPSLSIPQVQPVPPAQPASAPDWSAWWPAIAAFGVLLLGGGWWWQRRSRPPEAAERLLDDFDAELDAVRSQALADPRVTADVIKLWMRA